MINTRLETYHPEIPTTGGFFTIVQDGEIKSEAGKIEGYFTSRAKLLDATFDPEGKWPYHPTYHIVTTARSARQDSLGEAPRTLHSWVRFANAGDYFAAIKGDLVLSYGMNVANGIVYGRNLKFAYHTDPPPVRLSGLRRP